MDNQQISGAVDESSILPILKQISFFSTLDETLHREIIKHIILMYYPVNYNLFKEGDNGDALYIIKKGKVKIYKEPKEGEVMPKDLAELSDGTFFGEMALISDIPRNATAKTAEDSEIFILSKDDFTELLKTIPTLAEQVSAVIVSRLNQNDIKKN